MTNDDKYCQKNSLYMTHKLVGVLNEHGVMTVMHEWENKVAIKNQHNEIHRPLLFNLQVP